MRSEILPSIARHIEGAANPNNSISFANYHSRATRSALEQLFYIDDRIKSNTENIGNNLISLTDVYSTLLMHYIRQKHKIHRESYWFPRRLKHKRWFFAGDSVTSMALKTSSQQMLVEEKPDHNWLEREIVERLAGHIAMALKVGDLELALKLLARFSSRISVYAMDFQFEIAMRELKTIQNIIIEAFASNSSATDERREMLKIGIADTWAALGSNLCLETLRRIFTFEKDLKDFFEKDVWSEESMRLLPALIQLEFAFIVRRIDFERKIEGRQLSKPKYVQQLAVQKLLNYYARLLPEILMFYQKILPGFEKSLMEQKMPTAATQVVLASLHSHWKLPRWFDELGQLLDRYYDYEHYKEVQYVLPKIDLVQMLSQLGSLRDDALAMLGNGAMVEHIFESNHNEEQPDHFGQIYFELAEACIEALEENDENKLNKILPMFMTLAFLAADSKFTDESLDVDNEFRLHLISSVINDLASVLGFAILYGAYFDNEKLSEGALKRFDAWIEQSADKAQYLRRMVLLSDPYKFSLSASPRGLIRTNWEVSFERRARHDGFGSQMGMERGRPHPNVIVREFLVSHSDASHLFFALHVLPELLPLDFRIDYHITELYRRLKSDAEAGSNEDH